MQDCTEVLKLLNLAKEKCEQVEKLNYEASDLKKKAQGLCKHPAVIKQVNTHEDEFGRTLEETYTYTCAICGKGLEE